MTNPVGRPPAFKTPEAMQEAIEEYFAETTAAEAPLTVSGLAYHLGITTKCFRNYEVKEEFIPTVKRAKQRIEVYLETRLDAAAPTGTIFNLKNNFGWKDSHEVNSTVTKNTMTEEELNASIAQRMKDIADSN